MDPPDLPAGVYRHYKQRFYLAFGYGHDANIDERVVVHYVGLELDGAHGGPRLTSRTAVSDDPEVDAWWDFVHEDGSKCTHHQGTGDCTERRITRPRFEYIGPSWHPKPQ